MILPYTKMSGAGNTFIVVEERCLPESVDLAQLAPNFCSEEQEYGGADGVIAVGPGNGADFAMRYFNRDGSTGMMCGNGGRCAVRFAVDKGYAQGGGEITFTNAGATYRARITERGVKVWFPDPKGTELAFDIDLDGTDRQCHYCDVGTPHAVVFVEDGLAQLDLARVGPLLRGHERFAPEGANANFVAVSGDNAIRLRTFERGVEAETGACGTGAISSAIISAMARGLTPPIEVTTTSGEKLYVDFTLIDGEARELSLEGGAEAVASGEIGLAW